MFSSLRGQPSNTVSIYIGVAQKKTKKVYAAAYAARVLFSYKLDLRRFPNKYYGTVSLMGILNNTNNDDDERLFLRALHRVLKQLNPEDNIKSLLVACDFSTIKFNWNNYVILNMIDGKSKTLPENADLWKQIIHEIHRLETRLKFINGGSLCNLSEIKANEIVDALLKNNKKEPIRL